MMSEMRQCCYCQAYLSISSQHTDIKCEKCKKNEAKYKVKPTYCIYCQLPAAFVEEKCVWCAYGERKTGPPVSCAKCKIKSAFPKNRLSPPSTWVCRLCSLSNKAERMRGNRLSLSSIVFSTDHKRKRDMNYDFKANTNKAKLLSDTISEQVQSEHILVVQQYKDEVSNLRKRCMEKDKNILERDKKIAELNAEVLSIVSEGKKKMFELQKQHEFAMQSLYDQVRSLRKQIKTLRKGS